MQDYTRLLVREDIQEYLQRVHPLHEQINRSDQREGVWSEPAAELAHTYLLATDGLQLFSLYRLAIQADRFVADQLRAGQPRVDALGADPIGADSIKQRAQNEKANTAVGAGSNACLRRLYADQWPQTTAKGKHSIRRDFDSTMHAGVVLVGLVGQFGAGILITCTPKVHKM